MSKVSVTVLTLDGDAPMMYATHARAMRAIHAYAMHAMQARPACMHAIRERRHAVHAMPNRHAMHACGA